MGIAGYAERPYAKPASVPESTYTRHKRRWLDMPLRHHLSATLNKHWKRVFLAGLNLLRDIAMWRMQPICSLRGRHRLICLLRLPRMLQYSKNKLSLSGV